MSALQPNQEPNVEFHRKQLKLEKNQIAWKKASLLDKKIPNKYQYPKKLKKAQGELTNTYQ